MHSEAADTDDVRALREMLEAQQAALAERDRRIERLTAQVSELVEQLHNHQRARFGQSSERDRLSPVTNDLFNRLDGAMADPNAEGAQPEENPAAESRAKSASRGAGSVKARARQPLPDDLPRRHFRSDFDAAALEELRARCGGEPEVIGFEVTEVLEYESGYAYVARYEAPKYVVPDDEGERTVVSAQRRCAPIPHSQVGASLLAHTVVSKVADHLPLNRIATQFARDGIEMPRQRLSDYMLYTARILDPLVERMRTLALESPVLHSDDTTIPQREKGRRDTRTARVWTYLGRGREDGALIPFFEYTETRGQDAPLKVLAGYTGYLQADAYTAYRNADRLPNGPSWVACWAHARRGFEKVAKKHRQPGRAHRVLRYIRALYQLERRMAELAESDPEHAAQNRRDRAQRILRRLHALLDGMLHDLPPRSELARAVGYALNHWAALVRYTDDLRLELDNNRAERLLRGVCIGRKNWNFTGSASGGNALAVLLSLVEGCRLNGVNPKAYLVDVLTRIQDHPDRHIDALLPHNWAGEPAA